MAANHIEAGQFPAHRAVFKRHDAVLEPGVDQRLAPDDAACSAGTVHDHQCLGVGHDFFDTMDQLGARAINATRDTHVAELFERTRVEHHDVGTIIDHRVEFRSGDARRAVGVLNELAERLGGNVHA